MRCPAAKFATHGISHFLFLILLAAATFRLDENAQASLVDEEASSAATTTTTSSSSVGNSATTVSSKVATTSVSTSTAASATTNSAARLPRRSIYLPVDDSFIEEIRGGKQDDGFQRRGEKEGVESGSVLGALLNMENHVEAFNMFGQQPDLENKQSFEELSGAGSLNMAWPTTAIERDEETRIRAWILRNLRPSKMIITHVQICIVLWIVGKCFF
ncbi:unnamed protein product [Protopolystoma xenopodis]|uniref:Uncharacterized protein n=1 Tax=Protopolystoma xenopodis TaxID=117903 RepID=A0A448WPN0_9PLAT|nr:unnamed protein product [Protopolystoma xenopodis]